VKVAVYRGDGFDTAAGAGTGEGAIDVSSSTTVTASTASRAMLEAGASTSSPDSVSMSGTHVGALGAVAARTKWIAAVAAELTSDLATWRRVSALIDGDGGVGAGSGGGAASDFTAACFLCSCLLLSLPRVSLDGGLWRLRFTDTTRLLATGRMSAVYTRSAIVLAIVA
jgi:hypothetical protein